MVGRFFQRLQRRVVHQLDPVIGLGQLVGELHVGADEAVDEGREVGGSRGCLGKVQVNRNIQIIERDGSVLDRLRRWRRGDIRTVQHAEGWLIRFSRGEFQQRAAAYEHALAVVMELGDEAPFAEIAYMNQFFGPEGCLVQGVSSGSNMRGRRGHVTGRIDEGADGEFGF